LVADGNVACTEYSGSEIDGDSNLQNNHEVDAAVAVNMSPSTITGHKRKFPLQDIIENMSVRPPVSLSVGLPIECFNGTGKVLIQFPNLKTFREQTKMRTDKIKLVLSGKRNSAYSLGWRYCTSDVNSDGDDSFLSLEEFLSLPSSSISLRPQRATRKKIKVTDEAIITNTVRTCLYTIITQIERDEEKKGNDEGLSTKGEEKPKEDEGQGEEGGTAEGKVDMETIGIGQKRKRKEPSEAEIVQKKEKRRLQRSNRKIFLKERDLASRRNAEANQAIVEDPPHLFQMEPSSSSIQMEPLPSSLCLSLLLEGGEKDNECGNDDDNTNENIANINENIVYMCAENDSDNIEDIYDDADHANESIVYMASDGDHADEGTVCGKLGIFEVGFD
jgi:hypothetical protein